MNGSPLFTGDAGSGESEIRRFILENDLLEALIALPEQLFYNTGIATYVWVVTNRKAPRAEGQGAAHRCYRRQHSGCRCARASATSAARFPLERAQDILKILADFKDGDTRKVTKDGEGGRGHRQPNFPTTHFGFRKITVERPLRLNFQASPERIARLEEEKRLPGTRCSPRRRVPRGRRSRPKARALQEAIRKLAATAAGHGLQGSRRVRARARRRCARRPGSSCRRRLERRSSPPCRNGTRRRPSAATRMAIPSPIRSCATMKACRSRRASRHSSSAR